MKNLKKKTDIISFAAGLAIFLIALAVVLFYIFKRCRGEFNADFTDTLLWANASVESGHFYNPDYWYAYFLPFSGIPLFIPIVAAFGMTYFSHQLGMTVFVIIFAVVLFMFMRSMGCTYAESFGLSGVTMILMCASTVTRMIFYGHIIHYSLVIVFMCVAFSLKVREAKGAADNRTVSVYTIIIAIWCMLCCTNGMATLILFFAPFVGCFIIDRFLDARPISLKGDRELFKTTGIYMAGGLVGYLIKMIFFSASEYEDSITALLPSDGWVWKQSPFLLEWIKVLTDASGEDVLMQSFDGIRILCMYVLALLLLIVPVFALIYLKKIEDGMLRLLIIYYWLMAAATMLTYSVSYALVSNWRLSHLVCGSVIVTILFTRYLFRNGCQVRWAVVFILPVLCAGVFISMLTVRKLPSSVNANPNDQLIEIFNEHGLTRGYSTSFWNSANSATVLSDGNIVVSPITLWPDGSYEVRHYQSEPWEYEDVPGLDRYFVVIGDEDLDYAADTLGANKIEEIKYQDNTYIWVFDRNIFSDLAPVFTPSE